MRIAQRAILTGLIALGVAWGACVMALGLHALTLAGAGAEPGRPVVKYLWLGVAGIAAGNFVFMEVVADRLIWPARRWLLDAVEFTLASVMIVAGVVGMLMSRLGGGYG